MRTNVRRRGTRFSLLAIAASLVLAPGAPAQNFVASRDAPVPGQPKWIPSFAFPQSSPPASDPKPWLAIDPFTSPEGYAKAVLAYFMEGQNTFGFTEKLGRGGRLNGPLDNRSSTCISCHMTAQKPNSAPFFHGAGWDTAKCWFRNLPPTQAFGDPPTATTPCGHNDGSLQSFDFSLQLQVGWRNWRSQHPGGPPAPPGPVPHAAIPVPAGGDPLLQPLIIDGRVSQPLVR